MIKILKKIIDITLSGFYYICLVLAEGFFFYFYIISLVISLIIPLKVFEKITDFFKNKQKEPVAFLSLVLFFFMGVFIFTYFYTGNNEVKYVDNKIIKNEEIVQKKEIIEDKKEEKIVSKELNLFRKYGDLNIYDIDILELKKDNNNIVSWIMVDGTSINYPVVQTIDNDYYLNHDINGDVKSSGWVFMDYRNDSKMNDKNTIIYGHNLINKTSFGSLSNIFTEEWFNNSNHYIVVKNEEKKFVYEIFSCYYIEPEIYYLHNNFDNDKEYINFLRVIKDRSIYDFSLDVSEKDKIITLSTCTDDNKGRKVIHAKLIAE